MSYDNPIKTTWALLILKKDYKFDEQIKYKASVYWDYALPGEMLCIIAGRNQYNDDKIEDAKYVRKKLFRQKGFCAE